MFSPAILTYRNFSYQHAGYLEPYETKTAASKGS